MNRLEFYSRLNEYKDLQENKDSSLQHYGTLGQKWGVRKWQNADGTFNEAGKERYFGKNGTTKIGSSDKKIAKLTKKANNMLKTMYDNMDPETIKKQQDYMNNFSLNVNVNNAKGEELAHPDDPYDELTVNRLNEIRKLYPDVNTQDQKIGMTGIVDAIVAVNAVIDAVHNYDDVQELRDKYSDFMNKSETDYSKDDRLSIMNNKKRIAFLQNAIETGNQEAYDKYLKKVPEKDREAVKKLIEDINKTANKQKVSEENQEILDEHLGSISKPKIHKSYLNEDGTLNERGKTRTASNRKISDVASSVFLALRNINIFEAAATGIGGLILSFSGFGIPLALATTLASGIMAGAAGVDNALYKKLEKRADAYYEMLQ